MFEIAISARNRIQTAQTRYDWIAGRRFENKVDAERFCGDVNYFCHQERFLVVRVGSVPETGVIPFRVRTPEKMLLAA